MGRRKKGTTGSGACREDARNNGGERGEALHGLGADEDRYLDVQGACRFLSIGKTKLYELIADTRSGLARIVERPFWAGERIRIPSWKLREWAEERCR